MTKTHLSLLALLFFCACAAPNPQSAWTYPTLYDKLRQKTNYYATVKAAESYQLKFPYQGGTHGVLTVAKTDNDYKVGLAIDRGPIDCKQQCTIPFRFDNGPLQTALFQYETPTGKTVIIPINNAAFLNQLKTSTKLIAELPNNSNGKLQFTFTIANLDLAKIGPTPTP